MRTESRVSMYERVSMDGKRERAREEEKEKSDVSRHGTRRTLLIVHPTLASWPVIRSGRGGEEWRLLDHWNALLSRGQVRTECWIGME